jgi:hypothetical protein
LSVILSIFIIRFAYDRNFDASIVVIIVLFASIVVVSNAITFILSIRSIILVSTNYRNKRNQYGLIKKEVDSYNKKVAPYDGLDRDSKILDFVYETRG